MNNIFIFTASSAEPKEHLTKSVDNPFRDVPYENYLKDQKIIESIKRVGDCYCWGNTGPSFTDGRWENMSTGDYLLGYQNGSYTHFAQIIGVEHNKRFAEQIWGHGQTQSGKIVWWEYMYFFTKPEKISIHWKELPEIRNISLSQPYRGFTDISKNKGNEDHISNIISNYGSLESYFKQKLSVEVSERIEEDPSANTISEGFGAPPIKHGSGGESERHKKLKLYIRDNPDVIEIENVINRKDERYYPTGDHVDVWFEDSNGEKYVVEIELEGDDNLLLGAKQLIKYRALEAVENDWDLNSSRVKAVLVAYNCDGDKTTQFCGKYDIELWQTNEDDVINYSNT